jgi:hypothetical protein
MDLLQLIAVTCVRFSIAQVSVVFGTGAAARELLQRAVFSTIAALESLPVAEYAEAALADDDGG